MAALGKQSKKIVLRSPEGAVGKLRWTIVAKIAPIDVSGLVIEFSIWKG